MTQNLLINQILQELYGRDARLRALWQVPLLNGEFEYIAAFTAEVCE